MCPSLAPTINSQVRNPNNSERSGRVSIMSPKCLFYSLNKHLLFVRIHETPSAPFSWWTMKPAAGRLEAWAARPVVVETRARRVGCGSTRSFQRFTKIWKESKWEYLLGFGAPWSIESNRILIQKVYWSSRVKRIAKVQWWHESQNIKFKKE